VAKLGLTSVLSKASDASPSKLSMSNCHYSVQSRKVLTHHYTTKGAVLTTKRRNGRLKSACGYISATSGGLASRETKEYSDVGVLGALSPGIPSVKVETSTLNGAVVVVFFLYKVSHASWYIVLQTFFGTHRIGPIQSHTRHYSESRRAIDRDKDIVVLH
jgi:hypothetical protein